MLCLKEMRADFKIRIFPIVIRLSQNSLDLCEILLSKRHHVRMWCRYVCLKVRYWRDLMETEMKLGAAENNMNFFDKLVNLQFLEGSLLLWATYGG